MKFKVLRMDYSNKNPETCSKKCSYKKFILHPSSFTLHPSSFTLHPSSFILHPSSSFRLMGRDTVNLVLPGTDSTSIVPSCFLRIFLTISNPNPLPCPAGFVVKNGSKIFC